MTNYDLFQERHYDGRALLRLVANGKVAATFDVATAPGKSAFVSFCHAVAFEGGKIVEPYTGKVIYGPSFVSPNFGKYLAENSDV